MSILGWFQQKHVTGEIIHDFGVLHEPAPGSEDFKHTLLLCRKDGREQIVIRHERRTFFSGDTGFTVIPADRAEFIANKFQELAAFRRNADDDPPGT